MTDPAYDDAQPQVKTVEVEVYQPGHLDTTHLTLEAIGALSQEQVLTWWARIDRAQKVVLGGWLLVRRKEFFDAGREDWNKQFQTYAIQFGPSQRTLQRWMVMAAESFGLEDVLEEMKTSQGGAPQQPRQLPKPKSLALKEPEHTPSEQQLDNCLTTPTTASEEETLASTNPPEASDPPLSIPLDPPSLQGDPPDPEPITKPEPVKEPTDLESLIVVKDAELRRMLTTFSTIAPNQIAGIFANATTKQLDPLKRLKRRYESLAREADRKIRELELDNP